MIEQVMGFRHFKPHRKTLGYSISNKRHTSFSHHIQMDYDTKYYELLKYSNPEIVNHRLQKYLPGSKLYMSTRKGKKYMIHKPDGTWSHFGQMRYQDYTKHKDQIRRVHYLQRATNIHGSWENDPYSPNNLSIHLLW
jgi:hypothetical protein